MSYLRFNHVFFGLMTLALLAAFVFSPTASQRVQGQVQGIFAPVAWPLSKIGAWAHNRVAPRQVVDDGSPSSPRSSDELRRENEDLRISLRNLRGQLERLAELETQRSMVGDARPFCTPFSVVGSDAGHRDSLLLSGSSLAGLREGMPVLSAGGIVGRLSAVGVGGARVRLVSDPGFRFEARFARLVRQPDGTLDFPLLPGESQVVDGRGDGVMMMRITEKEKIAADLRKDDWIVLSDRDWPLVLTNYRVGRVDSILPTRDPGFVQIIIKPDQNLEQLEEVMVMNKEKRNEQQGASGE
ncbi:MAG TPA: rod shape-determining protein MreC [Tepidisphaeraceae bacterium]|nr:rod shape-determining protein MreC [Tepidisphaeraceae bacterium]